MNLQCGGASFPSNATFYQDISAAALDPESGAILSALDAVTRLHQLVLAS